jgi:hypothetical protein
MPFYTVSSLAYIFVGILVIDGLAVYGGSETPSGPYAPSSTPSSD